LGSREKGAHPSYAAIGGLFQKKFFRAPLAAAFRDFPLTRRACALMTRHWNFLRGATAPATLPESKKNARLL
jgi:hypothetical protein